MTPHEKTARELLRTTPNPSSAGSDLKAGESYPFSESLWPEEQAALEKAIAAALSRTEAATLRRAEDHTAAIEIALNFSQSCILSGEEWTADCAEIYRGARTALQSLRALAEETRHEPHE